jgi:hypothetical protein
MVGHSRTVDNSSSTLFDNLERFVSRGVLPGMYRYAEHICSGSNLLNTIAWSGGKLPIHNVARTGRQQSLES